MSGLRIVRVQPFFAPAVQFGGPVAQAEQVCRSLVARGADVSVVTTDNGVSGEVARDTWVRRDGYRVWYAGTGPFNRVAPYHVPSMQEPLERAVADADVVCLNVGLTLVNVLARSVAGAFGVPYVYNAEGALCPHRLRSRGLAKWVFRACFERRVLADAAAVQAVTQREASDLERAGVPAERIHVIPNGIDLDAASATPSGVLFRAVFPLPPGARIVLYLGRVHPLKGLDLLVRAVAACAAEMPDLFLVVAGPVTAAQRSALDQLATQSGLGTRLRWCGVLRGALRWSALRAANVFALTSWTEGLPNSVLEACAVGTPVLITDGCNVPEVEGYGAGCVVRPSVAEIAEGLRTMLASEVCATRQGEAGQRMVAERFALKTVVDRLETLYRDVAARCRRAYGAPVPSTA